MYLSGKKNIQVFHDNKNILLCYIPSLKGGKSIVRKIQEKYNNIIFEIVETSAEVTFKFKAADIEKIDEFIQLKTYGNTISPFSVKNLPKEKYTIPEKDLNTYKKIIKNIDKSNRLIIGRVIRDFDKIIENKIGKSTKGFNVKADKRKKKLKGKEYIHSIGMWDEFIDFLKEYLV